MKKTYTGLKTEHAEAVYENHLKGDPPFKPQKGNFGKVSWFAGTGNPYVGGQTQSYTVIVDVFVPENIVKLQKFVFNMVLTDYLKTTNADIDQTNTHRAFWEALGRELEGYSFAEVFVPRCAVSRQGEGTFISANSEGRLSVSLADPGKMKQDLIKVAGAGAVASIETRVELTRSKEKSFVVILPNVKPEILKKKQSPTELFAALASEAGMLFYVKPVDVKGLMNPIAIGPEVTNPVIRSTYSAMKKLTLTVSYLDGLQARQQAKSLASVLHHPSIRNKYGTITIQGGADWNQSASRAYNAIY